MKEIDHLNEISIFSKILKPGEDGGKCPHCGRALEYKPFEPGGFLGTDVRYPLPCECLKAREAKELKQKNEEYRKKLRRISGMKEKHMEMTFESLTERDQEQAEAVRMCKDWADTYFEKRHKSGLVLMGGVGAGKTHLLCAVLNRLIQTYENRDKHDLDKRICNQYPMPMFYFISTADLFFELSRQMNTGDMLVKDQVNRTVEWCRNSLVLFLDDLGAEKASEYKAEQLFGLIDHRIDTNHPTIISTNVTQKELELSIGERTMDRIKGNCSLIPISSKSHRNAKRDSA